MKLRLSLIALLCTLSTAAVGQVTYCRDIGNNKTYCTGGTIIHRDGKAAIIQNPMAAPPSAPMPPNPLLQNNALPSMNAPYSPAGTQNALPAAPPAPALAPAMPTPQAAPVIVVPAPAGGRVCHQFGNTLVCN